MSASETISDWARGMIAAEPTAAKPCPVRLGPAGIEAAGYAHRMKGGIVGRRRSDVRRRHTGIDLRRHGEKSGEKSNEADESRATHELTHSRYSCSIRRPPGSPLNLSDNPAAVSSRTRRG